MALTPSKDKQSEVVTLDAFGHDVMRRRAALGADFAIPRNGGVRRTKSKTALLEAIEASGGKW